MRGKLAKQLRKAAKALVRMTMETKGTRLTPDQEEYLVRQQYRDLKKRVKRK